MTAARTCSSISPSSAAAGISQLPEGQPVTMKVVDTQKGREAVAIELN